MIVCHRSGSFASRHRFFKPTRTAVQLFVAAGLLIASFASASSASAAGITVTPNTNDVMGLKSNSPTSTLYPNRFPLGARVCNTTGTTLEGVTATLTWGTATGAGATNINLEGSNVVDLDQLAVGGCLDAYFQVLITRAAASFESSRQYSIAVTASGGASGVSPTNRRVYVERLIAQNRNSTTAVAGPGGCNLDFTVCDPAPTNLIVDRDYTFKLYGYTSTAQNTVEAFLDFPGTIFRVVNASSTASNVTAPAQASVPSVFNDACSLKFDWTQPDYLGCATAGGAGGKYAMTYRVRIISAGSGSLKAVIYDGSAGNWHLNSDYGSASFTSDYVARWPLDVSVDGDGTVTSNIGGINCGKTSAECLGTYDNGQSVTLTATPGADESFIGWSGACSGASTTCVVSMTQARSVTALFSGVGSYPLDVSVTGLGSVSAADSSISGCTASTGDCEAVYEPESLVTLTATPQSGQSFAGWSGDGCSGVSTSCVLTMSQARSVTAAFVSSVSDSYQLSTDVTGGGIVTSSPGGIDCGATCAADFVSGASVTLTATPAEGSIFVGWSGACTGTETTCTVTMDQIRYVTAEFATPMTLSVVKAGSGAGTVTSVPEGIDCGTTCSSEFGAGELVTLTATSSEGSIFVGWSGACSGTAACEVSMTEASVVTATFSSAQLLSVERTGSGDGSVTSEPGGIDCGISCSAYFATDSMVTLTADANIVSTFVGWAGAGTEECWGVSCTVTMSEARSVTAEFAPLNIVSVALAGSPNGGTVTSSPDGIDCGESCFAGFEGEVLLTATPAPGSVFLGWGGSCTGTDECWVMMDQSHAVTATFLSYYEVQVSLTGEGTGTVVSEPAAIDCGATCSTAVADGSVLEFTATPSSGSVFIGWTGAEACSTELTCSVTVDEALSLEARFEVPPTAGSTPDLGGAATVGQTLNATDAGPWSGSSPIEISYQWLRCDPSGSNCIDIEGADDSNYVPTFDDAGQTLRVRVTGTNVAGSDSEVSNATPVITEGPSNLIPPVVSGNDNDPHPPAGTVMTATLGTWRGDEPITYSYQWQACDALFTICVDITGATTSQYIVTTEDVESQFRFRIVVTGTNAISSASAVGDMPATPEVETDPTIAGTEIEGSTLTSTDGTWSGTEPIVFTYQWLRCDNEGANCAPIEGSTESTHLLTPDDVNHTLRLEVTGTNTYGSESRTTSPSGVIAARPPVNEVPPVITGVMEPGQTVTATTGSWSGTATITYSYQWELCDSSGANCTAVPGATDDQLVLTDQMIDGTVRVVVTATNVGGSASEHSAPGGLIVGVPPTASQPPVISGSLMTGSTLTTTNGTWTGTGPFTFTYQWLRCDSEGANCVEIEGATGSQYELTEGDVGSKISVVVTAENIAGTETAVAEEVGPVTGLPPEFSIDPSATGTPTVGSTFTGDAGEHSGSVTEGPSYQWQRCSSADDCVDIEGATATTYVATSDDLGLHLKLVVTIGNASGTVSGSSDLTERIADTPLATTLDADEIGSSTARLRGTIDPRYALTSVRFEYGETDAYGNLTPIDSVPATAIGGQLVTANVESLTASTTYHFRVVSQNLAGEVNGEDITFSTSAGPNPEPHAPDTPSGDFSAEIDDVGTPQEKVVLKVRVPTAGKGRFVGYTKRDRFTQSGAVKSASKDVVAIRGSFTADQAGDLLLRAKLTAPALRKIRSKGLLRIDMRLSFVDASGIAHRFSRVLALRPYTISEAKWLPNGKLGVKIRTPRTGTLTARVVYREKETNRIRTIKSMRIKLRTRGVSSYEFDVPSSYRSMAAANGQPIMIKSTFVSSRYPAFMWRTRYVK